MCTAPATGQGI
ncbi:hypothetical protein VCHC50A2_1572A, partial [Vibrio cholerae HC-50A2]